MTKTLPRGSWPYRMKDGYAMALAQNGNLPVGVLEPEPRVSPSRAEKTMKSVYRRTSADVQYQPLNALGAK